MMLGALADLIGRNRNLIEQTLERVRQLEEGVRDYADNAVPRDSGTSRHRRVG
jgi:hypothetical protein